MFIGDHLKMAFSVWVSLFFLQNLELERIQGYRGFDARSNLFYVNDGSDMIFHAAGAGIVQNLSSGKHAVPTEHCVDSYLKNAQWQNLADSYCCWYIVKSDNHLHV